MSASYSGDIFDLRTERRPSVDEDGRHKSSQNILIPSAVQNNSGPLILADGKEAKLKAGTHQADAKSFAATPVVGGKTYT